MMNMNIGVGELGLLVIMYVLESVKYLAGYFIFFREKTKKIYWMAVGLVLLVILCAGVKVSENTRDILVYVIVYLSMLPCVKGRAPERAAKILLLVCAISCLGEMVGILIKLGVEYNATLMDILENIASLVVLGIIFMLIRKRDFCFEKIVEFIRKSIYILIAFVICFLLFIISALPFAAVYTNNEKFKVFFDVLGILAFLCVSLLIIFVIYIKNLNERLEKTVEIKIKLEEMQKKYFEAQLKKEESTRRYRHDMEGKLQGLMALAVREDVDSVRDYIAKLQENLHEIKNCFYETGIDILDIILTYNFQALTDVDIRVIGRCRKALEIDNVDFSAIFSNLIRNSAEAVAEQKTGNKYIHIKIEQGEEYIRIGIKNSTDRYLEYNNNRLRTSKRDKKNHGIGLLNTEEMVKRNGGVFEIIGGEGTFEAIVIYKYVDKEVYHSKS